MKIEKSFFWSDDSDFKIETNIDSTELSILNKKYYYVSVSLPVFSLMDIKEVNGNLEAFTSTNYVSTYINSNLDNLFSSIIIKNNITFIYSIIKNDGIYYVRACITDNFMWKSEVKAKLKAIRLKKIEKIEELFINE